MSNSQGSHRAARGGHRTATVTAPPPHGTAYADHETRIAPAAPVPEPRGPEPSGPPPGQDADSGGRAGARRAA
ncbi:hypothetical protein ACWGLE_37825, partial [Streptomyces sp. NPDC055897]